MISIIYIAIIIILSVAFALLKVYYEKQRNTLKIQNENLAGEMNKLKIQNENLVEERNNLHFEFENFKVRYSSITNIENKQSEEKLKYEGLLNQFNELNNSYKENLKIFNNLKLDITLYENELDLMEFGLYKRQFDFETSEHYKIQIENNYRKQKDIISNDKASYCWREWTVNNSIVEGRKMTRQYKKLMLSAFNGECDTIISKVKWNNVNKSVEKIEKNFATINKLGTVHNIEITEDFLKLKLEELHLNYEFELQKYNEKEEFRRKREDLREEERARIEYEKAQKEAEEEEKRYQKALDKVYKELEIAKKEDIEDLNNKINYLQQKLEEVNEMKQRAISMAQITKAGHIYIISNIGSFGADIYKIGMTRRLDPMDRVYELGDASVPFKFDVHAIIYSENAPKLEYDIHKKFSDKRLNLTNYRREFFKLDIQEVEEFISVHTDNKIDFIKIPEAREYRESLSIFEQLNPVSSKHELINKYPENLEPPVPYATEIV